MEVFDVHTTLSMREFDMFSQVHFNQQPFEFVYMNISKRFAKIPFSWPHSAGQLLPFQEPEMKRDKHTACEEQLYSSHSNSNSTNTFRSFFPLQYLFYVCILYQAKCFKDI